MSFLEHPFIRGLIDAFRQLFTGEQPEPSGRHKAPPSILYSVERVETPYQVFLYFSPTRDTVSFVNVEATKGSPNGTYMEQSMSIQGDQLDPPKTWRWGVSWRKLRAGGQEGEVVQATEYQAMMTVHLIDSSLYPTGTNDTYTAKIPPCTVPISKI